jgi:hypothetical protein
MRTEDPLFCTIALFFEFGGLTGPYFPVLPNKTSDYCHLTAL